MKKIALLIILVSLLSACATPIPESTPTPMPTNTQIPTATPAPTFTPSSTIEPWIQSLPDIIVSVELDKEIIYGLDAEGQRLMIYDTTAAEWVKIMMPLTVDSLKTEQWNGYTFELTGEGYYIIYDANGNAIKDIQLWDDGTADLKYMGKTMSVAFQAITSSNDILTVGLWDYEGDKWSEPKTNSAPKSMDEINNWSHKLVVVGEPEGPLFSKTLKSVFDVSQVEFTQAEIKREFEDTKFTWNWVDYVAYENVDPRPKHWKLRDWTNNRTGQYWLSADASNSNVPYGDSLYPMQVMVEPDNRGYFSFIVGKKVYVKVPIAVIEASGRFDVLSGIVDIDNIGKILHLFNRENRGKISSSYLYRVGFAGSSDVYDQETMDFTVNVNKLNIPEKFWPEGNFVQQARVYRGSLPNELKHVFWILNAAYSNQQH